MLGYGSQALALKYLGISFEHWKICEWAVKSIQAYKDIHFTDNNTDFSKKLKKEDIIYYLNEVGVSRNYNEPMTFEQIKRLSEKQLRTIYNNIFATNNLVNIQQVKGKDLDISDTDNYDYLLTYSFPCQDLSLAGKRKGMSDASTRSGMLWEVERILKECKELGALPQILLMENVPQVHSEENKKDFFKWQLELEKLGYKNYVKDLIATNFGIPQTRDRCFMISILGDYNYNFPKPIPLQLRLKDLLENNVDEKYYLSDKMINCFLNKSKDSKFPRKERFLQTLKNTNEKGIAATLCTTGGTRATDNFIGTYQYSKSDKFMHGKDRLQINKEASDTLQTTPKEGVVIIGNYSPSNHNASRIVNKDYVAPTVMENHGTVTAIQTNNLKIRKLTPMECFRLMGVKDEDYKKIAKNQSDSSLYHLAGDSIVVNVLIAIFKELI